MTEAVFLWSKTAASNASSDGAINWAEGQAPSTVNNSARAMMAAIANYRDDIGGQIVSTGSTNEYTIATNQGLAAHANGVFVVFRADKTNTGAATTTIDGLGQKNILRADGTATQSGDIVSGGIYTLRYSSTAGHYLATNLTAPVTTTLSDIGALTATDGNIIVGNGTTWVAESGATARTSLGLAIGTNVQAWDADLDAIAALANTDGNFIVGNGSAWVAESGATARTSLGAAGTSQTAEPFYGVILGSLSDRDYRIVLKAAHAGTITETTTRCVSGTATATFKVNALALGGTANSVSSSEQSQAHSTSNTFAAGDDIVITISSNSSCVDMSFSIAYTRTLS